MKNNKQTEQWEESPVREKIRSKRKKRKYKERLAVKKQVMLSAEKIQLNWERYLTEVKNNISEERSSILLPFLKKYEERFMMMPASSKN